MPQLQQAVDGLPDARHRLNYIVDKTAAAAGKALDSVDPAKVEQAAIAARTQSLARSPADDPSKAMAAAAHEYLAAVLQAGARVDGHLGVIMRAQDFQDLTGQVVDKVVRLATELEHSLLTLRVRVAPPEQARKVEKGGDARSRW